MSLSRARSWEEIRERPGEACGALIGTLQPPAGGPVLTPSASPRSAQMSNHDGSSGATTATAFSGRQRGLAPSLGAGVIRDVVSGRAPLRRLSRTTKIERVEPVQAGLPATFVVYIARRMAPPKEQLYAAIGVSHAASRNHGEGSL